MHPITAQIPFTRLWPQSPKRRPDLPPETKTVPPAHLAPPMPGHDFLVSNARPDLMDESTGKTQKSE